VSAWVCQSVPLVPATAGGAGSAGAIGAGELGVTWAAEDRAKGTGAMASTSSAVTALLPLIGRELLPIDAAGAVGGDNAAGCCWGICTG
jgi:hypothetical protein